jgi:hypothetical protein
VAKAKASDLGRPVMVTTEHRGVFFGYLDGQPGETVTIRQARCCLYWTTGVKGFLGLAAKGPSKACRVGPPAPSLTLMKVTSVAEVAPEAVDAWEDAPWA